MPDFGIFRGFGSKLFSDKLYAGQLPTQLGLIGSQSIYDADAQAYFDRVTIAGGSLSDTEKTAVNQLVLDLKGYSIWSKMKAIYPMVGASAAACAQNLVSSSFTGTFTSGWTFASTGVTPNGTSAYMNTNFNPNGQITSTNAHLSFYQANANRTAEEVQGIFASPYLFIDLFGSNSTYAGIGTATSSASTATNKNSMFILTAASSTAKLFRNTTQSLTFTATGSMPNWNVYFGAANDGPNPRFYSNGKLSFASIGDGLTDTEASNFYTAVQAMNTTLSRQV